MFTGLIQEKGKLIRHRPIQEGKEFTFFCSPLISQIKIDDSVAVNGVCLTVVKIEGEEFKVHCVSTSLQKTNLGSLQTGEEVNLELALRIGDRMGGHWVQGHVNGVATLESLKKSGEHTLITLRPPESLMPYIVKEGSITIDGISLTVHDRTQQDVIVSIIPHTMHKTTLPLRKKGDKLNVEVDILAKYLEGLIFPNTRRDHDRQSTYPSSGLTLERLTALGFMNE